MICIVLVILTKNTSLVTQGWWMVGSPLFRHSGWKSLPIVYLHSVETGLAIFFWIDSAGLESKSQIEIRVSGTTIVE